MILIVDDEVKIANVLNNYLLKSGYETKMLHDGNDVMKTIEENPPELVLLDVMLPNIDGLTLCKEIKEKYNFPVILVTARRDEIDRIMGLEIGADDYVCKPFSPKEVVARVKARLRVPASIQSPTIQNNANNTPIEGLCIDFEEKVVWFHEERLDLTPVEYRLLITLLQKPGFAVSREKLLDEIYEDKRIVGDRTVDSHVKNLRKKFQKIKPETNLFKSVYKRGYKLEESII